MGEAGETEADALGFAVAMLLGREPEPGEPDAAEAAETVGELAEAFAADSEASGAGVRVAAVAAELHAIEAAAGALAAALGGASPATLDILSGRGIGGAPLSLPHVDEASRLDALAGLAGRYALPLDPAAPRASLALALARRPDRGKPAAMIEWPVGAEALRELARARRREFEALFRAELLRIGEARDHGPSGALPPAPGRRRPGPRRRANDPASEPDVGGRENAVDLMRGAPGWALARDGWLALRRWRPDLTLAGTRDGPLHAFLRAVRTHATGEGPDADDAGLEHRARAAVKIMGALERIEAKGALSEDDFERWASLGAARHSGEVPAWLA